MFYEFSNHVAFIFSHFKFNFCFQYLFKLCYCMLINIILYTSNINQTVKVSEKVDVLEDYLDSLEISGIKKL